MLKNSRVSVGLMRLVSPEPTLCVLVWGTWYASGCHVTELAYLIPFGFVKLVEVYSWVVVLYYLVGLVTSLV